MKTIAKILPIFLVLIPFSADAESMYDVKPEVKVEAGAGVSGSSQGSGGSSSGSTQTGTTVKVEDGLHTEDSIRLDGSRSSDDGVMEVEVEIEHGVEVETETHGDPDFDLFVQTVKEGDENVVAADADGDDAVEVEYEHEARLFGFIPVTLMSKTSVKTEGGGMPVVKVSLPWWSFLVSGSSELKSSIETSLSANAELSADATAPRDSSSGMSTGRRVKLVEVMVSSLAQVEAVMKASYDLKAAKK